MSTDSVSDLAGRIREQTDNDRIDELASIIEMLSENDPKEIGAVIAEDAREENLVYFEDYIDDPRSLDNDDAVAIRDAVRAYQRRNFSDCRLHFHRSGSSSHEWMDVGHDKIVAVSIDA